VERGHELVRGIEGKLGDFGYACLVETASSADTPDGSNPLPELAAFKAFGRDSAARVATPPVPAAAGIIGSYYPAAPVTGRYVNAQLGASGPFR